MANLIRERDRSFLSNRRPAPSQTDAGPKFTRKEPGEGGHGHYYHVVIRPKGRFVAFRTIPVAKTPGVLEVLGRTEDGAWQTQKILIDKHKARLSQRRLLLTTDSLKRVLPFFRSHIHHLHNDLFFARQRQGRLRASPRERQQAEPAGVREGRRELRSKVLKFHHWLAQ